MKISTSCMGIVPKNLNESNNKLIPRIDLATLYRGSRKPGMKSPPTKLEYEAYGRSYQSDGMSEIEENAQVLKTQCVID